jgi:hypothetical protein
MSGSESWPRFPITVANPLSIFIWTSRGYFNSCWPMRERHCGDLNINSKKNEMILSVLLLLFSALLPCPGGAEKKSANSQRERLFLGIDMVVNVAGLGWLAKPNKLLFNFIVFIG